MLHSLCNLQASLRYARWQHFSAAPCRRQKGLKRQARNGRVILPARQFTSKRSERLLRPCAGAFRSFGRQKNNDRTIRKGMKDSSLKVENSLQIPLLQSSQVTHASHDPSLLALSIISFKLTTPPYRGPNGTSFARPSFDQPLSALSILKKRRGTLFLRIPLSFNRANL